MKRHTGMRLPPEPPAARRTTPPTAGEPGRVSGPSGDGVAGLHRSDLRTRRMMRIALGALWTLDGLLALQPNMGINNLGIILMGGWGQPRWMIHLLNDTIVAYIFHHHLAQTLDLALVGLQLGVGLAILTGVERLQRAGLIVSVPLGLLTWFVGEWAGGLLARGASFFTGAPGAALLYVLVALLLLRSSSWWARPGTLVTIRRLSGILWLAGAVFQVVPWEGFWAPGTLVGAVRENAVMSPERALTVPIYSFMAWAKTHYVPANAVLAAGMTLLGIGLLLGAGRWFYAYALAVLIAFWWIGENFGALLGQAATDPNSAPLWALLLLPGWQELIAGAQAPHGGAAARWFAKPHGLQDARRFKDDRLR